MSIAEAGMNAKGKLRSLCLAIISVFLCLLTACQPHKTVQRVNTTDTAMGTIVSLTFYDLPKQRENMGEELLEMIRSLEEDILSWRMPDSRVALINQNAGGQPLALSEELYKLMVDCRDVWQRSGGAFDVTLGTLTSLWNFDERAMTKDGEQLPTKEQIRLALSYCDMGQIQLNETGVCLGQGQKLDLGAVGKGWALDELRTYLDNLSEDERPEGAIISLGGSILTYGRKPDGLPWKVAVINPKDDTSTLGYLELEGMWCVSTSGDYERYVEIDGVRYHHILDPHTGYPADAGLSGVTILSQDGFLSDALSTACFVLGKEKGMELAADYRVEILVVDKNGNVDMSDGMKRFFHGEENLLNP